MKKIRVGVIGLGNLGKSCIEILQERASQFELIAIFTRSGQVEGTLPTSRVDEFVGKIDVMLVCVGSSADAPLLVPELASKFNTVDSFDTHAKLPEYIESIRAKQNSTVAVVGTGWDPGIFSLMRIYFDAFSGREDSQTFWGKGVSLGHSNAIRKIEGVVDAIQFTVPKTEAIKSVRAGEMVEARHKHKRVCYVVANEKEQSRIEQEIRTMPNYFEGQEVEVNFVSAKEFGRRFKGRVEHGGLVVSGDSRTQMEFRLKLKSNPHYTACAMVAYTIAVARLADEEKIGVYTVADIAPRYLACEDFIKKV